MPSFSRNTTLDSRIAIESVLKEPILKQEGFMPDMMSPA